MNWGMCFLSTNIFPGHKEHKNMLFVEDKRRARGEDVKSCWCCERQITGGHEESLSLCFSFLFYLILHQNKKRREPWGKCHSPCFFIIEDKSRVRGKGEYISRGVGVVRD